MSEPFGFTATYEPAEYEGDIAGWKVTLPEKYDAWTITAPSYYDPPVAKVAALAALGRFIAEAQHLYALIEAAPDAPECELSLCARRPQEL